MKTSLDHLPPRKQRQLEALVAQLRAAPGVEMVILFGSHARGDWVEDPVGGYFSDYDVLVIVDTPKAVDRHEVWSTVEQRAERHLGKTVLSLIVHDAEDVNRQLTLGGYFFGDIEKEGIVLHDTGRITLADAKEKTPEERRAYAELNYAHWFESACFFLDDASANIDKGRTKQAAFYLHQATERSYTAALLVLTEYKPKAHNIDYLGKLAVKVAPALRDVFPKEQREDKRLFDLLKRAYIEARYSTKYVITLDELRVLEARVRDLRDRVERLCKERIEAIAAA